MCGGELDLQQGMNIAECPYCGTKQTVPTLDDKLIRLYNRANQYRLDNEFDKAYSAYEAIVAEKNDEAEAYWGMVLSEFGIEYVEDPKTGKRVPTCHRTLVKSISVNENYKSALMFADLERKIFYEDEAEVIDSLQKKILNASAKEEPYDVFICYKETDANGNRTEDSVLAQDIYNDLTNKGFKVFFSRITLEDKLGKDYEPCIFAALTSAKVMLVVTTDSDNCNAVWVKNEWKRYIEFMKTDKDKTLIPVYKNMSPYALPDEFARLQAQDMSKIGAIQDLVRGVEKLIGKGNNSKTGLSESEQKLLNAFEKSQQKKKNTRKIALASALGVLPFFILYSFTFSDTHPEFFDTEFFTGISRKFFIGVDTFIPFVGGIVIFLSTLFSMLFFGKKSFKYAKYSFGFLFASFSVWLILESMLFFTPTSFLWLAYAFVGIVTALCTIIDAIINKKIPFFLLILLVSIGVLVYENSIPERSNERDSSVEQIVVLNKEISIYDSTEEWHETIGFVCKDEIYTILESQIVGDAKWVKIENGYNVKGYIKVFDGDFFLCEYLPVDEEIQEDVNAKREKELADIKAIREAIDALNGVWKWQNFFGYYMLIEDGKLYTSSNLDSLNNTSGYPGIIEYNPTTKTYILKDFSDAVKLTYDGKKIRMYDENGDSPSFYDEYATRYN